MQLINDNPPSCMTEENLRVVTGSDRTITNHNLQCQDKDIDTPVASLIFTINSISNGMILNTVNDPFTTVMKFTQVCISCLMNNIYFLIMLY